MNSKRLPIRACRLVSSTLLSAVPMDNRFIQSLKGRLTEFINNRKTITPACFRSLLKDYEFLIDPFDILRGSKDIKLLSMFGYELKYLYVACVFVGYERADAQNVVDMVYDVRYLTLSSPEILLKSGTATALIRQRIPSPPFYKSATSA